MIVICKCCKKPYEAFGLGEYNDPYLCPECLKKERRFWSSEKNKNNRI